MQTEILAPIENKGAQKAARKAMEAAAAAWKSTLRTVTIAEYHAQQPTPSDDPTQEEADYETRWIDAEIGIDSDGIDLELVAWTEYEEETELYHVWVIAHSGHEHLFGVYTGDTKLYILAT